MARLLEKALRRSEAVDREALCIVAGQKVRSKSLLGALFVELTFSSLDLNRCGQYA